MGLKAVRVLGMDTSTWRASVGLVEGDRTIAEHHEPTRGSHAITLLPLIDKVLNEAGCELADVDTIAVALGPGGFTGLRVGLSVAKGIALATGATVVGVSTLEALALAAEDDGPVCPMLDARRGEVYWALFNRTGGALERLREDALSKPGDATAELPAGCTVLGDASVVYRELIEGQSSVTRILPFPEYAPRGALVARTAIRQTSAAAVHGDFEPRYIRPSEAELKYVG